MPKLSLLLLIALSLLIIQTGCGSSTTSGGENSNSADPVIIGPEGGVLEVTDRNSELYGTRIHIPAGSLNEDIVISIKRVDIATVSNPNISSEGIVIDFGPEGTVFNNNIQISISYNDYDDNGFVDYTGTSEDDLFVVTWDGGTNNWTTVTILNHDKINNAITFEIDHFSIFTTVSGCLCSL